MNFLEFSQILFNLVISGAVIVIAVLTGIIAIEVIKFIGLLKSFFTQLQQKSEQLYEDIDSFIMNLAALPFLSRLFRKKRSKRES